PRADEQIYDCNMTTGADNLIPGRVLIIRDLATNQISVFDGLIKYLQDKPMVAKVKVDSPTRLELGWTVKHLPLTKGAEGMGIFALTFIKGDLRAHESVVLAGYDNAENRSGTCVLAK
ncbi:MAG: hypothetical protein B7Y02_02895, partial [Rhodobacterales bacterium 17-64-5]